MEQLDRKFEEMFGSSKTHTVQIPETQEQQYNPWNCSTFGYQEKTELAEIPEEDQQENHPIVIDLKHDRQKDAYDAQKTADQFLHENREYLP